MLLHVFAQGNAARIGTHGNIELRRHQNNGEILITPARRQLFDERYQRYVGA
jgi:hypothetical protein